MRPRFTPRGLTPRGLKRLGLKPLGLAAVVCALLLAAACGTESTSADPVVGWKAKGVTVLAGAGCNGHDKTCPGATGPAFTLDDFNPTSATTGQPVDLAKGSGKPRVVALLAGW